MKRLLVLTAIVVGAAQPAIAEASLVDARFTGTVNSQTNTAFTTGASIAGEFIYDTVIAKYLSFTIGGQAIAPGFGSLAALTPDRYSAIYQAQLSPVQQGGNANSTFTLDLEGINPWPTSNALALLLNGAQLASNLDSSISNFGFYMANADGTNIRAVNASLSRVQVSAIPEPGSVALLLIGVGGVVIARKRRHRVGRVAQR